MGQRNSSGWAGAVAGAMAVTGLVAVATLGGCQSTPAAASAADKGVRSDVTDIRPMGHPAEPAAVTAAYDPPLYDTSGLIPTAPQPVTVPAPVTGPVPAPLAASPVLFSTTAAPPAARRAKAHTHTVRPGETLFAIARSSYGNGAQWRRLAAANPAAAVGALRVGQQIIVP